MAEYKEMSDEHLGWHASGQGYRPGAGSDPSDIANQVAIHGGYANAYLDIDESVLTKIRERLADHPLIDLGGREGLSSDVLGHLGVTRYVSVDLRNSNAGNASRRLVHGDALTYLSKVARGMANVMANGFLVRNFFQPGTSSVAREDIRVRDSEYVRRLYKHAARVLPSGGIMLGYALGFTDIAARQGLRTVHGLTHVGTESSFGRETAPLVVLERTH